MKFQYDEVNNPFLRMGKILLTKKYNTNSIVQDTKL